MKVRCSSLLFVLAAILITSGCTHNKTIELNPKDADAYYNRGNAYDRLGDSRFANQDLKIAAKLGNIFAQKSLKEKEEL